MSNSDGFAVTLDPIDSVTPYEKNPRQITPDAISKVARSIEKFGFRSPIVVDEDRVILAGHTRLLASQALGIEKVPVHIATGLSGPQKRAYRLADNRSAEESRWDFPMLTEEFSGLIDEGFDLADTLFDPEELSGFFPDEKVEGLTDEDAVPEAPDDPVSVLGDVWVLGNHRLMCGDSTSIDAVEKLMNGKKANLFLTDPPYEITPTSKAHYTGDGMIKRGWMGKDYPVNHGKLFEVPDFADWIVSCLPSMEKDAECYIMSNDRNLSDIMGAALSNGWRYHNILIWQKPNGIPNRWYFKDIEFTFYGFIGNAKTINNPSSTCTFRCKHERDKEHVSQKPVELFEHYITNSSQSGEVVLEPFGGSGTALLACEKTNRICHAMELEPKYCDVIINRWQDFTGKSAVLEETTETFNSLKELRCKVA